MNCTSNTTNKINEKCKINELNGNGITNLNECQHDSNDENSCDFGVVQITTDLDSLFRNKIDPVFVPIITFSTYA